MEAAAAASGGGGGLALLPGVLLLLTLSTLVISRRSNRNSRQLPGPMALPLIGHLHLIRPPPHRASDRILARYGPLVYLRLGPSTHCVVAGTADAAQDLLKHETSFPERPLTAVTRHLAYDDAGFAFAPYGPHWRFMKRLCMSELLGPRTVDQLRPVPEAELSAVLAAARGAADRGEPIDVSRHLIIMANNTIMRMVASVLPGHMTEAARDCAKHVSELVGAFNVDDYVGLCRGWDLQGLTRRTREVRDKFDALLEVMITAKEENRRRGRQAGQSTTDTTTTTTKDLLDILMDAAEDVNAEVKLTRENIKAFVLDIFTAGSNTTATSVEWALALLINHPDCMAKLRAELDALVGTSRLVGEQDVARLPYLQAVFKETLRLQPPAVFAQRETVEPVHVLGYVIPPKTSVFFNMSPSSSGPSDSCRGAPAPAWSPRGSTCSSCRSGAAAARAPAWAWPCRPCRRSSPRSCSASSGWCPSRRARPRRRRWTWRRKRRSSPPRKNHLVLIPTPRLNPMPERATTSVAFSTA